jgi:hypothetical protein
MALPIEAVVVDGMQSEGIWGDSFPSRGGRGIRFKEEVKGWR